jgi:predicted NAD-dependent protein-ADP-ribosyltransferase YbiA (DUF1768 family)
LIQASIYTKEEYIMAVKATIAIDDRVMSSARDLVRRKRVKSFNALVESALRDELEKVRQEDIRDAIRQAAADPLFQADIAEVNDAFRFADHEGETA